jgi:hypothetical protein
MRLSVVVGAFGVLPLRLFPPGSGWGRDRLRWPGEQIVQDLNRFLLGWAGYFRYGNSTVQFDQISHHADTRLALWAAKRDQQHRRYGWQTFAASPDRLGLVSLNGTVVAPRPNRPWRRGR